ncbi:nicotinamide mononucleotide permease [Fusarium longipes]|uniref:Nicotinamide mononucleotide permease n=1 Tax=Fusarium longipes TaxID=694270 RepID=A0A395RYC2_9HYPO|nr:nicotinamide mononucleotide permease [Fusarium longipes]
MPTYLCHGFRWHRRDIRIFVILNDLEDAAPNWILAPASSYCILDQLHAQFDFLPELSPPTTPTQASVSSAKNIKPKPKPDHVDDDHNLPKSRIPDAEDAVLMHSWSPVKLLEEFDADEMVMACRPYAYVADHVVRIDLSVDVAGEMAKYYEKMSGDDGWIVKLRDELQKGEPVRWYVIVCGDEVREVPGKSDEEEQEVGYEQLRERAQHMARARRTKEIRDGSSNSTSEYEDDGDQDDALTVLEDILDDSEGAATPRPLSLELPDIDIPFQRRLDPTRASVLSTSTVWSQDQSPNETANTETPDIDKPLAPSELDPNRTSMSTAYSVWSRKETSDDGFGLETPDVSMPLLQSEITRYSTSTASGLYSENGHTRIEPEEFAKAQSPARSPIREEIPDVVQPLKPAELSPSRASTPPTPKALHRQLPAPSLYRPESFIPPFSPPLPSSGTFSNEIPKISEIPEPSIPNQTEATKPTEPSWPLSSDSPLGSSGSSTYRNEENSFSLAPSVVHPDNSLAATFHLPKEVIPPKIPSPASEYSPQPQFPGSKMPRFEEIVPHASPLLVTPNPKRLEKPISGVLYEAGEPILKRQPPSSLPRSRTVRAPPPLNLNTAKGLNPCATKNITPPTSARRETSDLNMKTPPRTPKTPTGQPPTQVSPKSRLPRSASKNIKLTTLPPPPEPPVKSPVRPPTPPKPKPRFAQRTGSQRRPQTAPEEGVPLRPNGGGFSRPYQYDVPRSMQKPGGQGVMIGPTSTTATGYSWTNTGHANTPLNSTTEARVRAQPPSNPAQSRQPNVSTQDSDGHALEGGKHHKHHVARSHSVADGFKRLFRRPSLAKGSHT